MAAKWFSIYWAGVFVVGGMFFLGELPISAAEELAAYGQPQPPAASSPTVAPAPRQVQPPAASSPTVAPAPRQLQPIPEPSSAMAPAPANGQPQVSLLHEGQPAPEECASEGFCGLPVCSPLGRFWLRADYLMWWTNGTRLPPLVTTSPQGTPVSQAGVLGYANTSILYGDRTVGDDGRSGVRTTLGMWLGDCHEWGLQFDYLSLGERANGFSQTSTGDPILARPFFNVQTNAQASELIAYRGQVEGTVTVEAKDYFQSAGVMLTRSLCSSNCGECDSCEDPCAESCGPPLLYCCRTDLLVGLRYYNLSDRLGVTEDLRITAPGPTQNNTVQIHDNFRARNDFYGSEIGLRTQLYRGRWSLEVMTKIALGNNHQTVTIDGQTTVAAPNVAMQTYNAGILAGGTNSGTFQRDEFTMIPQLGLELGYQVNCHWRAYVGYNILYWGSVARAADQVDLNLDPRNFPPVTAGGLPFPEYPGRTASFWAHGVNLGTEFRF